MSNHFLRVALWVLGVLAVIGNGIVLVWRAKRTPQSVNSILIISLAVSDLLMGIYLLIVAAADSYYLHRGDYFLYDPIWRNGVLCKVAGFLSFLSSEMSVSNMLIITIDRLVSVVFVFKVQPLRAKQVKLAVSFTWTFWILMAALPLLGIEYFGKDNEFMGFSSVCSPFAISPSKRFLAFKLIIFIVFNFVVFLVISISHFAIFRHVHQSRKRLGKQTRTDEIALAKKLSLILATDFCCWMPVVIAGLLAIQGILISPDFIAWLAVIILPVNASCNPFMYTSLGCKKKAKHQRQ